MTHVMHAGQTIRILALFETRILHKVSDHDTDDDDDATMMKLTMLISPLNIEHLSNRLCPGPLGMMLLQVRHMCGGWAAWPGT